MIREISAGIIIYRKTNQGPKFLLLYHGKNYWNFPKGKLDEGEKSFLAALREVREETGLKRSDLIFNDYFKMTNRYIFNSPQKQKVFKIVIFYLAETKKSEIKISDEHEGYAWFTYREALKMIKHKNLKPILKKAYETITLKSDKIN